MSTFLYGVANRGASIRIPRDAEREGKVRFNTRAQVEAPRRSMPPPPQPSSIRSPNPSSPRARARACRATSRTAAPPRTSTPTSSRPRSSRRAASRTKAPALVQYGSSGTCGEQHAGQHVWIITQGRSCWLSRCKVYHSLHSVDVFFSHTL